MMKNTRPSHFTMLAGGLDGLFEFRQSGTLKMAKPGVTEPEPEVMQLDDGQELRLKFHNRLEDAERPWQNFQAGVEHTPFQEFSWAKIWYEALGASRRVRPLIVFGYQGDALVLILPLGVERHWGTGRLVPLGYDLNDYNAPLIEARLLAALTQGDIGKIWHGVGEEAKKYGASHLYLPRQPVHLAGRDNPFAAYCSQACSVNAHAAHMGKSWTEYYESRFGKKSQRRFQEKEKLLNDIGPVQFRVISDPKERAQAVRQVLKWKNDQLEHRGSPSPFTQDDVVAFFETLAQDFEMAGLLKVFMLYAGDLPVAGAFGLVQGKSFLLYQTAYKILPHVNCSPGLLLLTRVMPWALKNGQEVFDFSAGDEPYKQDWCTHHTPLMVSFISFELEGVPFIVFENLWLKLKCWLKVQPRTLAFLKCVYKWVKRVPLIWRQIRARFI